MNLLPTPLIIMWLWKFVKQLITLKPIKNDPREKKATNNKMKTRFPRVRKNTYYFWYNINEDIHTHAVFVFVIKVGHCESVSSVRKINFSGFLYFCSHRILCLGTISLIQGTLLIIRFNKQTSHCVRWSLHTTVRDGGEEAILLGNNFNNFFF